MSVFTEDELGYLLGQRRLARLLIRIHPQRIVSWGIDARGRFSRAVSPG